jgi:hypothetical protein
VAPTSRQMNGGRPNVQNVAGADRPHHQHSASESDGRASPTSTQPSRRQAKCGDQHGDGERDLRCLPQEGVRLIVRGWVAVVVGWLCR